jgi:chitosanase
MMALQERIIPCSDFSEWKNDLEVIGYHVIDSTPKQGQPGFCTLRFDNGADHQSMAVAGTNALRAAPAPAAAAAAASAATDSLSVTQKRTAQAIVNIFETGVVLGMYGQVTVLEHDSGHLTFGRSQTTLGSGGLARLIGAYCDNAGARFGTRLKPYLPALKDRDFSLDNDTKLKNLLRATADDPIMRDIQDTFFETAYWKRAEAEAARMQIRTPLGIATVYDSCVHGSWEPLRDKTVANFGSVAQAGEKRWVQAYIATRRAWMADHSRPDIRATVYRMDALAALASHAHWALDLPLMVRDQEISEASLAERPPGCYDGPALGSRVLAVASPFCRGADVRLVQLGLSDAGFDLKADGVFGPGSANLIRQYQQRENLPATGVADLDLINRLCAQPA